LNPKDASESNSLAHELRIQSSPPIVATIRRPIRIELTGDELKEFRAKEEQARKLAEEQAQRRKRENEFQMVTHSFIFVLKSMILNSLSICLLLACLLVCLFVCIFCIV
jgi:hypothetical protein